MAGLISPTDSFHGNCRTLCPRMTQAGGATLNVMALLLVNMIGYAVGIRGAGRVAGGIFLDREGLLAVAYGFTFLFSGVQASAAFRCFFFVVFATTGGNGGGARL